MAFWSKWLSSYKMGEDNRRLREASGDVHISSRLTSFLYELMRDHLPVGTVEKIVRNSQDPDVGYCNGWLGKYAEDLSTRLKDIPTLEAVKEVLDRPIKPSKIWMNKRDYDEILEWSNEGKPKWQISKGYVLINHPTPDGLSHVMKCGTKVRLCDGESVDTERCLFGIITSGDFCRSA